MSKGPSRWFVRVNPDGLLGPKRQLLMPGGPLVSKAQDPYRRYLADLDALSKAIQAAELTGENLVMAVEEIRRLNTDPRSRR